VETITVFLYYGQIFAAFVSLKYKKILMGNSSCSLFLTHLSHSVVLSSLSCCLMRMWNGRLIHM